MSDLILPWPPSINHYYCIGRNKKTNKSTIRRSIKAIRYRDYVYYLMGKQIPYTGRVFLHIIANHPNSHRYDLDNLLKGTCDALEYAKVYKNDSQIDRIIIERGQLKKHGELIVNCGVFDKMILQ